MDPHLRVQIRLNCIIINRRARTPNRPVLVSVTNKMQRVCRQSKAIEPLDCRCARHSLSGGHEMDVEPLVESANRIDGTANWMNAQNSIAARKSIVHNAPR